LHRRLGQTQLARRKAAEREADVLVGTGAHSGGPFSRGGGGNRSSACASNPCYLCVAAALSASEALAFGGTRPPLSRSPGCGGGAGRRQRACVPFYPRRRCAPRTQLPHARVWPHILSQIAKFTKSEDLASSSSNAQPC
jgi:hypothetical protein